MINKDEILKKIDNMPIEELQKLVCQALDESGIEYNFDGDGISLSEFFNECLTTIREHKI